FALAIPIGAFYKFTADRLSLAWRDWMTHHLLRRYFFNRVYYRLRSSPTVDNPDQRITEDVKLFTTNVLGYLLIGRRLVGLHFTQYQREADFRYGLIRVRDNAESIAFFRGEKREQNDLAHR